MKNRKQRILFLIMTFFLIGSLFLKASSAQAPHTAVWTENQNILQGFLDKILALILMILTGLKDVVANVMAKFSDFLSNYFQHLRDWLASILQNYGPGSGFFSGSIDRFKEWWGNLWARIF